MIVVSGGGPVPPEVRARLPIGAPVIAADGGADLARELGLAVDVLVGDLDSVSAEGIAAAGSVERHPEEKDATDLALALRRAADLGDELVVVGTDGGRLDHLLAGILTLADPAYAGRSLRAHLGGATVHVLHGPAEVAVDAEPGSLLTIIPVGGDAHGVRTRGLRYPLDGETLPAGTTRGVSNVVDADAVVGLEAGAVLVVLP